MTRWLIFADPVTYDLRVVYEINACYIVIEHRSYQESTELVQNVIVTINNLSFYQITDSHVTKSALQISQCMCLFVCLSVCLFTYTCSAHHTMLH